MVTNMKKVLIIASLISLCACQTDPNGLFSKANIGTILGAGAGAALGSTIGKGTGRVAGIAAGTLLGALIGHSIGSSLDKADQTYYAQSKQNALENAKIGQTTTWNNPDSGNSGTTVITKTYNQQKTYCREYQETILVGGKQQNAYGTACRQLDGSWKIVK